MEDSQGYPYYGVAGLNGVAVMSSYEGAHKLEKYIREIEIYGYNDFELAEFWALTRFQQLSPYGRCLSYLPLNRAIFNKTLMSGRI